MLKVRLKPEHNEEYLNQIQDTWFEVHNSEDFNAHYMISEGEYKGYIIKKNHFDVLSPSFKSDIERI
jgi:hypothetical protein